MRFVMKRGHDFFWILIGAVGVGAAGDGDRGAKGIVMGEGDEFSSGFAGGIGVFGFRGVVFAEGAFVDAAVDFICRYEEYFGGIERFCCFENIVYACYVGFDEVGCA